MKILRSLTKTDNQLNGNDIQVKNVLQKESNHVGRRGEKLFDNDNVELHYEIRGHVERG